MDGYIHADEAASRIGVSPKTLKAWRHSGKHADALPAKTHVTRRVYYKVTDVESFSKSMFR